MLLSDLNRNRIPVPQSFFNCLFSYVVMSEKKRDPILFWGVHVAKSNNKLVAFEGDKGIVTYDEAKGLLEDGYDLQLQSNDGDLSAMTVDKNGILRTVADGNELNNLRDNWDLKVTVREEL